MTEDEIVEMAINCHASTSDAIRWAMRQEREKAQWDGIHTCNDYCDRPACVAVRKAVIAERESCAKQISDEINDDLEDEAYCILVALSARIRARGQS